MAGTLLLEFDKSTRNQVKMAAIRLPWMRKPLHIHAMNIGPPFRRKFITMWTPVALVVCGVYLLLTTDTYQWNTTDYVQEIVEKSTQSILDIEETLASQQIDGSNSSSSNNTQKEYLIPRRIHQAWISNEVVHMSSMWIKTWMVHNPQWEYWFWTPAEAMPFLKKYYPEYLGLYESFRDSAMSADLIRYLVLHHYGGFFLDLDMKCLKPLDTWALMYSCFVSKEPYEHIFLYDNATIHTVANGLLVCRPGHPFLLKAVQMLVTLKKANKLPLLNSTGSTLLSKVLLDYRTTQSNNEPRDDVKLIPPKYFMSTYDESQPRITRQLSDKCTLPRMNSSRLHVNEKSICRAFHKRQGDNSPSNDSYTNHYWLPLHGENSKRLFTVSIFKIVPETKTFRHNGGTS